MADGQRLPPEIAAPLARFNGEVPPAPGWFDNALARQPERSTYEVAGAAIELLTWGEAGKPGLLFLHGNGAHADWWSYIAPYFADDWRVAAISWSGMGGSGWRDAYTTELLVEEILGAIDAAGLDTAGKPVLVGHSFGGHPAMAAARDHGERLRAVVAVDTAIFPPGRAWSGPPMREGVTRIYPTLVEALGRFRLAPPQTCENLFIADYIARHSLRPVDGGWTWKFDPHFWKNLTHGSTEEALPRATCPVAIMWGERSRLLDEEVLAFTRAAGPAGAPRLVIPDADHHVIIDQPLAFVAALRGLLAGWPS